MWYCSDITILLYRTLNLLHNTAKRPFIILHFSFSSWIKVCISCRPSWTSQFFLTGAFSSSEISYSLVFRMFITSTSKVMISVYLSCMFQLNACFTSTGAWCLCLCSSLWVTRVVTWGSAFASLSSIITVFIVCMAAWFTTYMLLPDSAIFCLNYVYFCLLGVILSSWMRLLLLTPCNVISLTCYKTDVVGLLLFIVCTCVCVYQAWVIIKGAIYSDLYTS